MNPGCPTLSPVPWAKGWDRKLFWRRRDLLVPHSVSLALHFDLSRHPRPPGPLSRLLWSGQRNKSLKSGEEHFRYCGITAILMQTTRENGIKANRDRPSLFPLGAPSGRPHKRERFRLFKSVAEFLRRFVGFTGIVFSFPGDPI
jgi:hypothetical protein